MQRSSTEVTAFLILIYSYFSSFVFAGRPYHGKPPLIKYIKTNPICSKSSLRAYSIPKCVLRLAYLAVPVKVLLSLNDICLPVLGSLYLFANPKSIIYITCCYFWIPIRKLSGLISLCKNPFWWTNSILCNIWIAIIKTVFKVNFRLQYSNKSSRLGPKRSITRTLKSPLVPK